MDRLILLTVTVVRACAALSSDYCLLMSGLVPQTRPGRLWEGGDHITIFSGSTLRQQGAEVRKGCSMFPDSVSTLSCDLVSDTALVSW